YLEYTLGRFPSNSQGIVVSDASDKSRDQKTLRRLAQNREAARKSRLRKKDILVEAGIGSIALWAKRMTLMVEADYEQALYSKMFSPKKGSSLLLLEYQYPMACRLWTHDPVLHTAYVQQLESSRMKLTQLEQELQRARQQGIFISSTGDQAQSMSGNGALAFDVEYVRWLEEHNQRINELRGAVNSHAGDGELRIIVDGILAHYDDIFRIKGDAAKADVFHILSGMWKTPAERCFLWLGGFRSSELLKLLINQLEPLTEQQLLAISNLQQSSQQAEDALSQGMEALQQSLAETLAGSLGPSSSSGNVANYMGQMAMAMGKLGTLEGFIRQADNLRQQTLQQMHRILTTRQSARALLAINDYFSRLRALSALWLARPR
ncbi:hypothetical protein RJ639_031145, partial [Escallonia herrerae]